VSSDGPQLPSGNSPPVDYEPGTVPLRPVVIVAVILLAIVAGYLGYACVHSSSGSSTFTDQVNHYAPGSVTYIAPARTYIARQPDGSFLALSEIEAAQADRVAGCVIRYRPDLSAGSETGIFRDDCHGVVFNREGLPIDGASPPMQRHPITSDGKTMALHFRMCLGPTGEGQEQPCRE
jgi:hypothetical protein